MLRRWPGSGGDGYGDRQLTTPRRSDPWPSRRRYGSEKMTPYISDKDGDSRMADQSQYQLFETAAGIAAIGWKGGDITRFRSEEHTSELQSLMRISYAVFCLKKKKTKK